MSGGDLSELLDSIRDQIEGYVEEVAAELEEEQEARQAAEAELRNKWDGMDRLAELVKEIDEICWRADLRYVSEEEAMGKIRGLLAGEEWKKWTRS